MAGSHADYLDPALRPPAVPQEGVRALQQLCDPPISLAHAQFAAFTMYNGGVFLGSQVTDWLDVYQPSWCPDTDPKVRFDWRQRWLRDLFTPSFGRDSRLVSTKALGGVDGRDFAHFAYSTAYAKLGIHGSRYRRCAFAGLALQRLLLLDYVFSHLVGYTWYGATHQKERLFTALGFTQAEFPHLDFESKKTGEVTRRYFTDHMPIGLAEWKLTFPIAIADDRTVEASFSKIRAYKKLWAALRRKGFYVHVALVLQRLDPGVWARRVAEYPVPPTTEDRRRTADSMERYLIERLRLLRDPALERTYGGAQGVKDRLAELDQALGDPISESGPMAIDIWYADRLSQGAWSSPVPKGSRVRDH